MLSSYAILKRILYAHIKNKWVLCGGILCMVVTALSTAVLATCLKPVFDDIFIGHQRQRLVFVALAVLIVFIIKGFSEYGATVATTYVGQKMMDSLQQTLFSHIIFLDLDFFHRQHEGSLSALLLNDIRTVKDSILQTVSSIFNQSVTVISLTYVMFYENFMLSLAAFFGLPLVGLLFVTFGRKVRFISQKLSFETGGLYIFFQQIFQNIVLIKTCHTENQEICNLHQRIQSICVHNMQVNRLRSLIHPIMEMIGGLAVVIVILLGGWQVMDGSQTTGSFLSFITALLFIYRPMKMMIQMNTQLQEGLAAAQRIEEVLRTQKTYEKNSRCELTFALHDKRIFSRDISFRNIGFAYRDTPALFQDLSCDFPAGKHIALVGPSGSGKTTLFYLLLRLHRAQRGQIFLGEHDIAQLNLQDLRRNIALVSQDIALFDDTIAANIAYGTQADAKQIQKAAELSSAIEFIESLENGYDTVVGAHGVKLSGGQRQRIALARAYVRNTPILLLDEATSALDGISEQKIQEATERLCAERTTLSIAHRLSTIIKADMIYVMHKGMVVQKGRHEQLSAQEGLYRQLAMCQSIS